jgi:ATP-dependent Clp protease protease subunit
MAMSPTEVVNTLVPIVIEKTGQGERSWDIYSRLLKERIIFIGDPIGDISGQRHRWPSCCSCSSRTRTRTSTIYINCPDTTSVTAGLAIYDTMQFVKCDIATYCIGQAVGDGRGAPRRRHEGQALRPAPLPRSCSTSPGVSAGGTTADVEIQASRVSSA